MKPSTYYSTPGDSQSTWMFKGSEQIRQKEVCLTLFNPSFPKFTWPWTLFFPPHTYKHSFLILFFFLRIYLFIFTFHPIFFSFIFISWRLITLQYCSDFCHTLTWISHGFTSVPHPDSSSHPPHPIPLGLPSALALSTCLMHPTWAGDLFHPR